MIARIHSEKSEIIGSTVFPDSSLPTSLKLSDFTLTAWLIKWGFDPEGNGVDVGGPITGIETEVLPTPPIPEPSTALLLGLGLAGLASMRRTAAGRA